jgi:single-stranded-DNA-specific exonuclease
MNWNIQNSKIVTTRKKLLEHLVKNRGIQDIKQFLTPISPLKISSIDLEINQKQLKKAVQRIKTAIKSQEKVLIYGDYDADGISATSLVWLALNHLGLKTQPFIPDRMRHGYGMSKKALQEIIQDFNPKLIITVDNGIVAHKELQWLKDKEIDVIVTDHHQPSEQELPAYALVHSTQISGAAVAWMLIRELDPKFANNLIDLVAISTIADQMPLLKANRSFTKHGLELLKENKRPGLVALCQTAKIKPELISAGTVGFMIAPRINAAGRIAHGLTAARLLCTQSLSTALDLAEQLEQLNQDRQDLTLLQFKTALKQAQSQNKQKILIVHSDQFHEGVIGLISGKITEKFYKPSIAIATEGDVVKASARSIKGVNITDLIREIKQDLLSVGGHELAAGFSAHKKKLPVIIKKLQKIGLQTIDDELLRPQLNIDAVVDKQLLSFKTHDLLQSLEPFGIGNRKPILAVKNCFVVQASSMGQDNQHLKLMIRCDKQDYKTIQAIGWSMGSLVKELVQKKIDLAFNLEINQWNGKKSLQLKIKDIILNN